VEPSAFEDGISGLGDSRGATKLAMGTLECLGLAEGRREALVEYSSRARWLRLPTTVRERRSVKAG
jgi:hypothetical protein